MADVEATATGDAAATPPRRRRRWRRRLLTLWALLLALPLGLWVVARSSWAQQKLAAYLGGRLSAASGYTVRIEDLDGNLPWDWQVGRLSLADAAGEWLVLSELSMTLDPRAYFKEDHHIAISRLSVAELDLRRRPAPTAPRPPPAPAPSDDPEAASGLPYLTVAAFTIERLRLAPEIVGDERLGVLAGDLRTGGPGAASRAQANLKIDISDGQAVGSLALQVDLAADPAASLATVKLSWHEELPVVLALLAPPEWHGLTPLSLDLEGAGSARDLPLDVTLRHGDSVLADASLRYQVGDDQARTLSLEGSVNPASLPLPSELKSRLRGPLQVAGEATRGADGQLWIKRLEVKDARTTLTLHGEASGDFATLDLQLRATGVDLAALALPTPEPLAGRVALDAHLLRHAEREVLTLHVQSQTPRYGAWQADSATVNLALSRPVTNVLHVPTWPALPELSGTVALQASGLARPAAPLPLPTREVAITGDFSSTATALQSRSITVKTEWAELTLADGVLQPQTRQVEARYVLALPDLAVLSAPLGHTLGGGLTAAGALRTDLALAQAQATWDATWTRPVLDTHPIGALAGDALRVRGGGRWDAASHVLEFEETGLVGDAAAATVQGRVGLPQSRAELSYTLQVADLTRLRVLYARMPEGAASASGKVHWADASLQATVDWQAADLRHPGATLTAATGRWAVGVDAMGDEAGPKLRLAATGRFAGLVLTGERALPITAADYAATLHRGADGILQIESLTLTHPAATLNLSGTVTQAREALDLRLQVSGQDLNRLSTVYGETSAGAFAVELAATGPWRAPALTGRLRSPKLTLRGQTVTDLDWRLQARPDGEAWGGSTALAGSWDGVDVTVATAWQYCEPALLLRELQVTAPEAEATGELTVDLRTRRPSGRLRGEVRSLAAWKERLGQPLAGKVAFDVALAPTATGADAALQVDWTAAGFGDLRAESVALTGRVTDVFGAPSGDLQAGLTRAVVGTATVATLAASATGRPADLTLTLQAAGSLDTRAWRVETRGRVTDQRRVELAALQGQFGAQAFALRSPTHLTYDAATQAFSWPQTQVQIGSGDIQTQGRAASTDLEIDLRLAELPVHELAPNLTELAHGRLSGSMQLRGRPEAPVLSATASLRDLVVHDDIADVAHRVELFRGTLGLQLTTREGGVDLAATLQADGGAAPLMSVNAKVPYHLRLGSGGGLARNEPIAIDATLDKDVGLVARYLLPEGHFLRGRIRADLQARGTLDQPTLSGQVTLQDGRYENAFTGTVLTDIQVAVNGRGEHLEISSLRATDGAAGTVTGSGRVSFDRAATLPFAATLKLANFTAIRYDHASAVAGGDLQLTGDRSAMALTGDLAIVRADAEIPPASTKRVPFHYVETQNGEPLASAATPPDGSPEGAAATRREPITMTLKASSDGRIFVRGRGIVSEWKGALTLSGSGERPAIVGRLDLVRGQYTVSNRRLTLTEGHITFDGSVPPAPRIHLIAEARTRDLTALITLSGPLDAPNIDFASRPLRPKEEIIAQLFLGQRSGTLSASQALAIANLVEGLTTGTSALDVVSRLRRLVGLDQLELAPGDDPDDSDIIRAGKYIGDTIFLEYEHSLDLQTDALIINVELNQNLGLESRVTPDGRAGVELFWKKDY